MIFIYNAQDGHTYHSLIHTKEIHRHCSTVHEKWVLLRVAMWAYYYSRPLVV